MKSSRKVIKALEVQWGSAVALKALLPPPSALSAASETASEWDEPSERAEAKRPAVPAFEIRTLAPDEAGSALRPPGDLAGGRQKAPAEAVADKARLMQQAQDNVVDIERSARAKAAEIEQRARARSAEYEQRAEEKAQEVVRVAKEQAAEVARQARREGFEAAEVDAGQLLLAAQGVLDEVRAWRTSMFTQSEQAILDLVAHIAKVIFGEGVTLPREALEAAFGRALTEARPLGNLRVRVHPSDAAILGPAWSQQVAPSGQRLELVPDESIRRGGCLVEGEYGMVDARVDSQLQLTLGALTPSAQTLPPNQTEKTGVSPA